MKLVANELEVEVRARTPADVPLLVTFIRKMAAFEKLRASVTEKSLRSALFGEAAVARALLAFVYGQPIGYATYFFSFASTMGRRALWLDDLFIEPAFRGKGIGKALMAHLAGIAVDNHCALFEWIVLDWNTSAIEFYEELGAEVLADWRICRLDEAQLQRLVGKSHWEHVRRNTGRQDVHGREIRKQRPKCGRELRTIFRSSDRSAPGQRPHGGRGAASR
jgi:GNAT superfamily N-acetyltransferase